MRHSYGDSAARIKFSLVSLLVYIIKSSRYLLGREKSFVHEIIPRLQCYMNFHHTDLFELRKERTRVIT